MTTTERILLAVIIVAVDLLAFAVPLTAFAAAYVIVARPPGFLEWVRRLYGAPEQLGPARPYRAEIGPPRNPARGAMEGPRASEDADVAVQQALETLR